MNPARMWPAALIAVLAVTVAANVYLLKAAQDPGAYVVERDYYRRAVAWDSVLAARDRSAALGWRLELTLGALERDGVEAGLRLVDRGGAPLAGLPVRVTAIHNAEAGRLVTTELATDARGAARGRLPLTRAGRWELRLEAGRGGERWLATLHRDVRPARASAP